MNSGNPYELLAERLELVAKQVREIESLGRKALYTDNDENAYRDFMRQKAIILAGLADKVVPQTQSVSDELNERIKRFSLSASQALEVGSVFFMSALLYPENYKEGDPNDLEDFAAKVKALAR
ncbi:hypothetical protein [Desulfovibrio sp. JC022]|uniref:hypothetical protein n=1 Tax=Desulfovibrio sp. JC022 TaxID=2593642 RepID=UPI0013D88066|nr:hypothetical protein [Desulfovibrio sp. JC022]NDV22028.1 hypothetical protein [Desulfovibrio sp. JC022]